MQIWLCQGDSGSKKSLDHIAITGETLPAGLIASEGKTTILTQNEEGLELKSFEHIGQPYQADSFSTVSLDRYNTYTIILIS